MGFHKNHPFRKTTAREKKKGQMRDFSNIYPFTDNYCLFLILAQCQPKFNFTLGAPFSNNACALKVRFAFHCDPTRELWTISVYWSRVGFVRFPLRLSILRWHSERLTSNTPQFLSWNQFATIIKPRKTKNDISTEKRIVVHKNLILIPKMHYRLNSKVYKNLYYGRINALKI